MDGIQASLGWARGAMRLLSWSLLPPSGHTAHHLPPEALGLVLHGPSPACQPSGFSPAQFCVSARLPGLACTGHIQS